MLAASTTRSAPRTSATTAAGAPLRLALPKGRMQDGVFALLSDAGIRVRAGTRSYQPTLSLPGFAATQQSALVH